MTQKAEELVAKLQEELDAGKRDTESFFNISVAERKKRQRGEEGKENEFLPSENNVTANNDKTSASFTQSTTEVELEESSSAEPATNSPPSSLHIEVCAGPHSGSTFLLEPRVRKPCFVGRSKGKKFKERGISLYKDTETSTTHGKFHTKSDGKFYFTDTDSTNGTLYKEKELEGCVPILLEDRMELMVGTSLLRVSLVR